VRVLLPGYYGFLFLLNVAFQGMRVSRHQSLDKAFQQLHSVGSDRLDKRTIDNRPNLSIIDNRLSIMIIIELGSEGPGRIYPVII
jgi:hypothetical protein